MQTLSKEAEARLQALVKSGTAPSVEAALEDAIAIYCDWHEECPLSLEEIAELERRNDLAERGIGAKEYPNAKAMMEDLRAHWMPFSA